MNNILLDSLPIWTTAQAQKTSNRGISASNQQLLGIQKLRELILELAVRGKLVLQDPNDEPASELLKKIEAEKKRLIKEGKIKIQKAFPDVDENDRPFQLPSTWEWVKIGNVGYTQTGGTPSKNDNSFFGSDIPFIKPGDIYPNYVDYANEGLSFKGVDSLGRSAIEGSILMVCIGTIGKCNLIDRICSFNQQINSISPYYRISDYLLLALRSRYFQDTAWEKSSSTTIAILNKGKWENIGIPFPPKLEQQRIVVKVDELMALCDELEKEQTNNNTAHEKLVEVLLSTLTDAKNSDDFKDAWHRVAACFDTLFTTEHSIDKLKQTILQLAVMGKLVPQDPTDEPASELLKKITKEKAKLVKEGKIKKQATLPDIAEVERPYKLPKGWEWVRIWDLAILITSGSRDWAKYYSSEGAFFITMGNLSRGSYELRLENIRYVNPPVNEEGSRTKLETNDLLISITGDVGNLGLIPENFGDAYINQHTCLIRFHSDFFTRYFPEVLRSPIAIRQFNEPQRGIKNSFRLGDLGEMVIPLPPFAEQQCIVSKIDELFYLCDSLKERILEAKEIQNILSEEIVRRMIN